MADLSKRKRARMMANLTRISESTVHRLSKYYRTLKYVQAKGVKTISSDELAQHNGITAAQVRKDLFCFGAFGRRGLGYNVLDLKKNISQIMGLGKKWKVCLIGVGNIGRALLDYDQFVAQGFEFVCAFDADKAKIGREFHGVTVSDVVDLEDAIKKHRVEIAVISVPAEFAQAVADRLVEVGIRAILNFAPVNISVPPEVSVRHDNMVIEIEALAFALTNPEWADKD